MSTSQDEVMEMVDFNSPSTSGRIRKPNKISYGSFESVTLSSEENTANDAKKINPKRLPPVAKKRTIYAIGDNSDKTTDPSNSEHHESLFTTKSESYRDKIKERFQSVKRQAGSSLSKVQQQRSFRGQADGVVHIQKALKLIKQENSAVDAELDKYSGKVAGEFSETEKYIFFCEETQNDEINPAGGDFEANNAVAIQSTNNAVAIQSTEVLVESGIENFFVQNALPVLLEESVKSAEDELLWRPTRKPVSIFSKIEHDEPRLLAEEGFYVSKSPKIPYINVLEQRLLCINDKKWFNCDGNLNIIENPFISTSYRPINSPNFNFNPEYVLPKIAGDHDYQNVSKPKVLVINVVSVEFQHHPLFSVEHIFERRLLNLYETRRNALLGNNVERTSKRLQVLRSCKKSSEDSSKASGDKVDTNTYVNEIKEMRNKHHNMAKQLRQNTNQILQTWRAIKKIRETNSYSTTSIKLLIHKEDCDYEVEHSQMQDAINQTISEIIHETEFEYKIKMAQFKEKLEEWKSEKNKNEPKPKKPTIDIDEPRIKVHVVEKFKESFKPPGEPILHFNLARDNEITKDVDVEKEQLRRQALKTTRIYLKISCDDVEVCKSKFVALNDSFSCFFEDVFSLQLTNVPDHILVEVFEQPNSLLKRQIGEVKLDVKDDGRRRSKPSKYTFGKAELVHYKHEGVGSGRDVKTITKTYDLSTFQNETLNTSGVINCHVGWERPSHEVIATNVDENIDAFTNSDGHIDVSKLVEWAKCANLDPQDPKNTTLFDYINSYGIDAPTSALPHRYFRCSPHLQSLKLNVNINDNIRFKVLELRNKNEPEFVGMVVPNRIKEMPVNVLASYKKRISEERNNIEDTHSENVDVKRAYGRKYLKQIYTKVFQQCRSAENNLMYEDVVNEKLIPYFENWFKTFIANFLNWFKIQPAIAKPLPKLAAPAYSEITAECTTPIKVIVHVISATNLPKRIQPRKLSKSQPIDESNYAQNISTFVEVKYQNKSLQTGVREGVNPNWDEELIFPLEPGYVDYLNPNSLTGSITLNIFEEVIENISEKKIKSWLGYIEVPLSTVYYSREVEGLFQVKSPILLRYDYNANKIQVQSSRNAAANNSVNSMHLSLKFQIEPNVPKLTINMEDLASSEPPFIHRHILNWNENHKANYPNGKFTTLAIDINGKTVCVTRFIRAVEPPQMNVDDFDTTPEQCARYVSLIPFSDTNKVYDQVWLTTQQMLQLMIGSITDHAIALTCYFLALNMETWLLIGHGVPHGDTAYVLIREHNPEDNTAIHFIYDVVSGTRYNVVDPLCPLQKIYCVIDETNVWTNIQRTNNITITQYNFTNRSDWRPLFNDKITAPSNSMQKTLSYYTVADVQELEMQLEKKLRKKITKLRKYDRTIWNHYVSSSFSNAINKAEYNCLIGKQEIVLNAHPIETTHTVHGYIIDLPYTNFSAIVDVIRSSEIINVDVPNSEFIFGLHIHSYPNEVFVMWILLGLAVRK